MISEEDNILGLNVREHRLADRVRDIEEQNQILRHQLSLSQHQLMSYLTVKNPIEDEDRVEHDEEQDYDPSTTKSVSNPRPCSDKVWDKA